MRTVSLLLTAAPLLSSALPDSARRLHPSSLDAAIVADLADEGRLLSEGRRELARAKLEHALDTLNQIRSADFEQELIPAAPPRAAAAVAVADFEALRTSVLDALTRARKEPSLLHETNLILKPHKALLSSIAAHRDSGRAAPSAEALAGLRQLQSELRPIQQRVAALALERKEGARAPAPRAPVRRGAASAAASHGEAAPAQSIEREREREFDTLRTGIRARLTLLRRADTAAASEADADALETARSAAAEWVVQHRTLLDGLESKRLAREAPSEAELTSLREMAASMEAVTAALPRSLERQLDEVRQQVSRQDAAAAAPATAEAAASEEAATVGAVDAEKLQKAEASVAPVSDEARAVEALKAKYDAAAAEAAEARPMPSLEALPTNAAASTSAASAASAASASSSRLRGEAAVAAQTLASAVSELAMETPPTRRSPSALARAMGAANGHTMGSKPAASAASESASVALPGAPGVSAERQAPQLPQFEHAGVAAEATERDTATRQLRSLAQSLADVDGEQTPPPAHAAAAAADSADAADADADASAASAADGASEQAVAASVKAATAIVGDQGPTAETAEPAAEVPTAAARQLRGLAASLDEISA